MENVPADQSERGAGAPRGWLRAPATVGVLVVVLGLFVTLTSAAAVAEDTRGDVRGQVDRAATDIEVQVGRRLEAAESALFALSAQLSTGATSPSELQWVLSNTRVVEEVPSLLAIVFAQATTTDDGLRVAPRAIHPLTPNVGVLGRNILRDPERRRAIEAARDTGDAAATSIVQHADGGVDAVLIVVPVYDGSVPDDLAERRSEFAGVMIAVVSPAELFADVANLPVVVAVEDRGTVTELAGDTTAPRQLWASSAPLPADTRTSTFTFADRVWRLTVGPGEDFPVSSVAWVIAVAGVLLSLLLGLVATLLLGRRDRLERLVDERTRELRQANEELERANRLRSQFITTVSHELRTPLTSVLGFIQTARRLGDSNPGAREDFLARAERNGLMLRRMIEELLDFGRLERGEVALQRELLDVGRVVAALVRDVRPALAGRQLLVRAERDTWASVDRDALERIVANLLSNAVQHAADAGPIQLRISRAAAAIEIACCDRGPGFLPEDIPVLFERFVRGSGVMGEGTGIGLAMVHELAVAHGGGAELRNRPGGGAEVIVRLPAAEVPAADPEDLEALEETEVAPSEPALSEVE